MLEKRTKEENKKAPKSIVKANVLVSYKQTALQGDNTTCLVINLLKKNSGCTSSAMRGNGFHCETEKSQWPTGTTSPACPWLPHTVHSPGPHASPCPSDTTAGPVSSSPQPCPVMGPTKPGPPMGQCRGLGLSSCPGTCLMPGLHCSALSPQGAPDAPSPGSCRLLLLSDIKLIFVFSLLVTEAVNTRTALQFKSEASGYTSRRDNVAEAFGCQKLQHNHKYENTMPKK